MRRGGISGGSGDVSKIRLGCGRLLVIGKSWHQCEIHGLIELKISMRRNGLVVVNNGGTKLIVDH